MSDGPGRDGALRANQSMGGGAEFDTIRAMVARWGALAQDIGDDAAVLPSPPSGTVRVVSTDACVEGVHFRRGWIDPAEVGARGVAAALSDLAAMGARPEYVLLALVVPEEWRALLPRLADGIGAVVAQAEARILGGNLSGGSAFSLTTTVLGHAVRPVPRAGARPGDLVVVTGRLGGPAAALAAWLAGGEPAAWARDRFARPVPRWREGGVLAEQGATAMIDVSDGVAADAGHVAAASGVALALDPGRLPLGEGVTPDGALAGGEEYELLATVPPDRMAALRAAWVRADAPLAPLTVVGMVEPGGGVRVDHGAAPRGFDHFA